jgi:hypothetical protein
MRLVSKKDKMFSKGKHEAIDFDNLKKYSLKKLILFFQEAQNQCERYLEKGLTEQAISIYEKQVVPLVQMIEKKEDK